MNVRFAILTLVLPAILCAQAAVEYAAGAARAATTTAPAQGIGKSVSGIFDKLNRTLESQPGDNASGQSVTTTVPSRSTKAAPAKQGTRASAMTPKAAAEPKPEVSYEDPSAIQEGMEYAEVMRRFGPPALKLTSGPGEETLSYMNKDVSVDATVKDGKVAAVRKSGSGK